MDLKAAYSVAELAEMSGLTVNQVGRIAEQSGLCRSVGGGDRVQRSKRWVWLSDLKERCPALWESILDRLSALGARGRDDG